MTRRPLPDERFEMRDGPGYPWERTRCVEDPHKEGRLFGVNEFWGVAIGPLGDDRWRWPDGADGPAGKVFAACSRCNGTGKVEL